jgi:hypothetical protein
VLEFVRMINSIISVKDEPLEGFYIMDIPIISTVTSSSLLHGIASLYGDDKQWPSL